MDVLVVHNSYQQHGGEDEVFRAEVALLRSHGHRVLMYHVTNDAIRNRNVASVAAGSMWSANSYAAIRSLIRREKPQVAHVHNTLPLVSPAAYYAAKREGLPVVQTLHNYRLLCPAATLFRDGAPCTECVRRGALWPAIVHRCYRGSISATGTVAAMLSVHRLLKTWTRRIDVYLALTEWSRRLFVSAGIPPERVIVKPNFVFPDPAAALDSGRSAPGNALFVGRLSPEKGIRTLLRAWREIGSRVPLEIAGDGPLASEVQQASRELPGVRWLGALDKQGVYERLAAARMLIVPSEWYEPFSLAVIEAYAMGVPVIASRSGALEEIVHDKVTGLHFEPGSDGQLCDSVLWLDGHETERQEMARRSRREFELRYTADANYAQLMEAYQVAIGSRTPGRIGQPEGMPAPGVGYYRA